MKKCLICGKEDIGQHGCMSCAIGFRERLFMVEADRYAKRAEKAEAEVERLKGILAKFDICETCGGFGEPNCRCVDISSRRIRKI
jgi:hypothetical protein